MDGFPQVADLLDTDLHGASEEIWVIAERRDLKPSPLAYIDEQ